MMNLALYLERAGREDAERPALGLGARVLRNYGEAAARVARLAGSLQRMGLKLGERVAIASKNSPDYVEALYAIWHAGLAAVPANAKLHGAELGYILEQSGARVCLASPDIESAIAPHAPKSLERLIAIGGAEYERLIAADPIAIVPRAPDDLAWLFYTSGTTGRPKGAMLTHKVLAAASNAYLNEVDTVAPGDPILHAAPMSHGSGLYMMAYVMRRGVNVVAEFGRLRAGGNIRPVPRLAAHLDVRGADHGEAAGGMPGRLPERKYPHHRVGRRADVCRGRAEGAGPVRATAGADLRPG